MRNSNIPKGWERYVADSEWHLKFSNTEGTEEHRVKPLGLELTFF